MNNGRGNMDSFILVLYVGIILFFLYRLYKSSKSKKQLASDVVEFNRNNSPFELVLFTVLAFTGLLNLYFGYRDSNKTVITTAIVMIILSIVFIIASRNKLYIASNGILANASFYSYKDIKKWGFDKEKGDMVLQVKKDNQQTSEVVRVKPDDIVEINNLIRKYKLNK